MHILRTSTVSKGVYEICIGYSYPDFEQLGPEGKNGRKNCGNRSQRENLEHIFLGQETGQEELKIACE